jgi:hypothetical protein
MQLRALLATSPDEQRKALLHGRGLTRRVDNRVVLAFERRALVVEQRAHDRAGLVETIESGAGVVQLDAVRPVLVQLPAGTEAEHDSAVADVVDAGGDLREHRWMAVRIAAHQRAESQPFRGACETAEHRPALERRTVDRSIALGVVRHEVVGEVQAVPGRRLGVAGDIEHIGPRPHRTRPDREAHDA